MGVDTRRPILPAPTESIVDTTTGESTTGTDLATDVSRRTDKTSFSIPDDGSPVTIPTQRRHRAHGDDSKLSRSAQHSQTSLLIEYFEGGKGSGSLVSRPSVRVRVTPSSSRKSKDHHQDHIQITEHAGGRKPIYSRRISLSSPPRSKSQPKEYGLDEYSVSSQSATDDQRPPGSSPVEIELMNRDQASELSSVSRDRYFHPTSDISSMPADSMLEAPSSGPRRKRSSSLEREQSSDSKPYLKAPHRKRSRSLSTERIAHRVAEKLSNDPREAATNNPTTGKGQQQRAAYNNRDSGDFQESDPKSPRRRFAAYRGDDENMSPESSLLSASALSSHRKSGDQYSFKSGTSKSSINNPKLLETVEDAIRRLILPELKELKKDQKVMTNTSKFERDISASYSPASSPSRDELGRRLSKHASAPDVRKPKVVLNKDSQDEGIVLSGDSVPSQRERRPSRDSEMTDTSHFKWGSRPELTEQEKLRRQRSRGLRDAEKAGRVGNALTAAALKHHDSRSSIDKNERRRPSGPRSRTGSVNETELVFQKHNVAPMPLRSAIESEMTRDSLLSEQTRQPTELSDNKYGTELVFQKHNVAPMPLRSAIESDMTRDSLVSEQTREPTELSDNRYATQEVSRGSPRQLTSPHSRSSNRDPMDSRYELKHSNMSSHNLSIHSASDHGDREQSYSPVGDAAAGAIAAAAVANLLGVNSDLGDSEYNDRRRTLSPIQSVASYQSESHVKQDSPRHGGQADSADPRGLEQRLSIDSLSSAPSTNLARSTRPEFTSQSDFLRHRHDDDDDHELGYESTPVASPRNRKWHQEEEEDDYDDRHDDHYDHYDDDRHAYRNSMAETVTSNDDAKRMTGYTDDSEVNFMEKVKQGHPVAGIGANPQFVHPSQVESAVASLLDPTILEGKSNLSGANRSQTETDLSRQIVEDHSRSPSPKPMEKTVQTPHGSRHGSPLKQRQDASSPDATSFPRRMGATSPPQSVTQSLDDQAGPTPRFAHEEYDHGSPSLAADRSPDSESEINTNPSIIQGPIGGVPHGHGWAAYDQTPSRGNQSPLFDNTGTAAGSAGLGLDPMDQPGYNQDYYTNDYDPTGASYYDQPYSRGQLFGTPPGIKDEGYVSAANPLSPSNDTPEPKGFGGLDGGMGLFDSPTGDHPRQLSGYSQGVGSPLYDSATGRGIERIQSKDIVALMDHLTVRDAQRNARDTEILVTLVRSAAEMRNSFEEMKKFISQQDDLLMESSDRQHDRTYRALGGPRPLPPSGPRGARQNSADDGEDMRSKRKNVFKRALKGLSLKSGNDLGRIEDMLEQLLDEVEILRAGQDDRFMRSSNRAPSVDPEGYEPEGHAGTSSENHSGYLSTFSRPVQEPRGINTRREPEHRVSTVPEADEEDEEELDVNERGEFLSPHLSMDTANNRERAGSAPVSTPPRTVPMASGALSNETTPKTSDKARKHKSSSSSFFPKISRWSKTTASSMGDNIRNSMQPSRKERVSFEASPSGSDLNAPYRTGDYYDPQGDDRLRSTYTLDDQRQENRPPSPLVPSQLSEAPKYRAHRDSLDLQHPQPRQGPTGRYQTALESQAQAYGIPVDQWGSNPSLSGVNTNNQRHSGASRLSPISDAGYSESSSRTGGPPRPPKIRDDGPLIPERAPKSSGGDEDRSYADRVASRSSAMRSPRSTPPPTRKPTGPRPLTSGNPNSPGRRKKSYYRASPDQVDDEHVY